MPHLQMFIPYNRPFPVLPADSSVALCACRDAVRPTPEQQQLGEMPQGSALTFHLSGPEQLAVGNGHIMLSNDMFNVGASTLEMLLGRDVFNSLLVEVEVPGHQEPAGALFPPGNLAQQQQQLQLVKIKAALLRWVMEAGLQGNSLVLGWLGVVLGQLHPDPEERLSPAQAAARLRLLARTYGEGSGALAAAMGGI